MPAAQSYRAFEDESPPTTSRRSQCAAEAPATSLTSSPSAPVAGEAIALLPPVYAALNPAGRDWDEEARSLTHEEIARRLRAAELGGLVDIVWQGLRARRERDEGDAPPLSMAIPQPSGPTIASQALLAVDACPGSSGAPQMLTCAASFVPTVPRMRGRVPPGKDCLQYRDGESATAGCMKAFGLILYNLAGMCSAECRQQA